MPFPTQDIATATTKSQQLWMPALILPKNEPLTVSPAWMEGLRTVHSLLDYLLLTASEDGEPLPSVPYPLMTSPGLNSSNPIVTQMAPVKSYQAQNKTISHEPGERTGEDEWVWQGREGGKRQCEETVKQQQKRNSRPLVIFNHSSNQSDS